MRRASAGFLVLAAVPLRLGAQTLPARAELAIDSAATAFLRETAIPGVALAIVRDGRTVYARGYGVADLETGAPMRQDLLVQIGSVTKPLTAALVIGLAVERRLDLSAPLGQYVRGLTPCLSRVPIGMLLSHTSGLSDVGGDYGPHDEDMLLLSARSLGDSVCVLQPGTSFSYANLNYAMAGLAAQEATGRRYADLLAERLLRPLGMKHATFRPTEAMTWPRASGHVAPPGALGGSLTVVRPVSDASRIWPAGFLYASADDLATMVDDQDQTRPHEVRLNSGRRSHFHAGHVRCDGTPALTVFDEDVCRLVVAPGCRATTRVFGEDDACSPYYCRAVGIYVQSRYLEA